MGQVKRASMRWTGENLDLSATLGSGYQFDMSSPVHGGNGGNPMEFLLAAAAACTAMDVLYVLKRARQEITGLHVEIEGEQGDRYPQTYKTGKIIYTIRGVDINPKTVERAIKLSQEVYCAASIMLKEAGMALETEYRIEQEDAEE